MQPIGASFNFTTKAIQVVQAKVRSYNRNSTLRIATP